MSFHARIGVLAGLFAFAAAAGFLFVPAIPQDPAYHAFADARAWLGMPNAANVLSKDRKSTRLNSSHSDRSRMPSSA